MSADEPESKHFITQTGRRLRQQYGQYRVKQVIGEGGMGAIVLEAEDTENERDVALKVFSPDRRMTHEMRRRFTRGARAAAGIDHPNVVQVYGTGEEGGRPYFAMELVRGRTLDELVEDDGRLPAHRAIELILQAARGLQAAADAGVIHRDVKPQNILVSDEGVAKIGDFGIAIIEQEESIFLQPGIIVGTPNYMSPEMCQADAVDHRSDIYSLGITFYELLCGRTPFHGSPVDVMYKQSHKRPRNIARRVPTLHPRAAKALMKMIAKKPSARFKDYTALIKELTEIQDKGLFSTRSRHRPGAVTGAILGIGIGLIWAATLYKDSGEEAPVQPPETPEAPISTEPPVPPNTVIEMVNGDFENGDLPTTKEPRAGGWWISAAEVEAPGSEITSLSLDKDRTGEGNLCLKIQLERACAPPSEEDVESHWGIATRFKNAAAEGAERLTVKFECTATGERPMVIAQVSSGIGNPEVVYSHRIIPGQIWEVMSFSFPFDGDSQPDGDHHVRFYIAGAAGDTIWLDDIRILSASDDSPAGEGVYREPAAPPKPH